MKNNWKKYSGALIWQGEGFPTHEEALTAVRTNRAIFARWISNVDCGYTTEWWQCIKDTYTPLEKLTAKQRYRVKRGLDNTDVRYISREQISEYSDIIFQIALDSFANYPAKYRPHIEKQRFIDDILQNENIDFWICYDRRSNTPCAYGYCIVQNSTAILNQVKVPDKWLKNDVNAALGYTITEYYLQNQHVSTIIDGERNIRHETNYQEFLVRVLQFRYAYCQLNIVYHPIVEPCIKILFPFRKLIKQLAKHIHLVNDVYCLLYQEEILRSFQS